MPSAPEVIIITGFANLEGATEALRRDAWDYIQKPVSVSQITQCVQRVLKYREERRNCRPPQRFKNSGIIGSNYKMKACLETVERAFHAGTQDYLITPFDPTVMEEKIEALLASHTTRRR